MKFTISSEQLLAICAFISAIWGVYKIIVELKKPNEDLKTQVEKHGQLLDQDNKRLKHLEDLSKIQVKSNLAMINHMITGNGIDKMKEMRDEIQEFMIEN